MSINAEIIAIGNEIISGDVLDTNSSFIAKELLKLGIETLFHTSVGDTSCDIKNAVNLALSRSNLIFITGGLGPTDDDISAQILAETLNREMVFHDEIWENIQNTLQNAGRKVDNYNKRQAFIPQNSQYFLNGAGTAPCIFIEEKNSKIFMLPGVPSEVKYFLSKHIKPYLAKVTEDFVKIRKIKLAGIPESGVNEIIKDIVDDNRHTIAFLPKSAELELKITAKSHSEDEATKIIDEAQSEIVFRLKEFVYGYDDTTIEEVLHNILTTSKKTVAVAESCTGGLISKLLTDTSGSSAYIKFNATTYSNDAKIRILGVKKETLDKFGAVSEETAKEMALGVLSAAESDFALSITGIAGPTGGSPEKPVGLVYTAISDGINTSIHKLYFPSELPREEIRMRAAKKSLHLLKTFIEQNLQLPR